MSDKNSGHCPLSDFCLLQFYEKYLNLWPNLYLLLDKHEASLQFGDSLVLKSLNFQLR